MSYERITDRDLVLNLNVNQGTTDLTKYFLFTQRLWELENAIEKGELRFYERLKPKYKVGDIVYFIHIKGYGKTIEECATPTIFEFVVRRVYCGKSKITYYLKNVSMGIDEDLLIGTREEAEKRLKEMKGENK